MKKRTTKAQRDARSLASKLGHVARRAKAAGKDPERAKSGYLGYLARQSNEARRAKGKGKRPPGAAKRERVSRDRLDLYVAPRDADGSIAPQPALGGGSVTDDILARRGSKLRKISGDEYEGVTGLWRVRATFAFDDDEEGDGRSRIRLTSTIDIPLRATAQEREAIVTRAVQDMGRSLIERDSSRSVSLVSFRIERAPDARRAGPKRSRRPWKERKKRGDKKRSRGRDRGEP
jgi:hypothetical protein